MLEVEVSSRVLEVFRLRQNGPRRPQEFGSSAECFYDLRIRLLKHRDEHFPYPNAAKVEVFVHRVTGECDDVLAAESLGVTPFSPSDKRTGKYHGWSGKWKKRLFVGRRLVDFKFELTSRVHRAQAFGAAAANEVHQDRFCLVVHRVGGENVSRAESLRGLK